MKGYDIPLCEVGRVLKRVLDEKDWSMSELARAITDGTGKRTESSPVRKWWTGERTPKPDTIESWKNVPVLAPFVKAFYDARRADLQKRAALQEGFAFARARAAARDQSAPASRPLTRECEMGLRALSEAQQRDLAHFVREGMRLFGDYATAFAVMRAALIGAARGIPLTTTFPGPLPDAAPGSSPGPKKRVEGEA